MEFLFDPSLTTSGQLLLLLCLACALGFEFVNGFHDTANAVATVIYTHSLRPWIAVIISGVCNFLGVFMGGIAVAIGILNLLPVELLVSSGSGGAIAMVLALLLSAIIWNLGTWWFGLPASSSHTLIGAIIGVGLANSMLPGHVFGDGVNWHKAEGIGLSLLVSPVFGFCLAGGLVLLVKRFGDAALLQPPPKDQPPPKAIRALLIGTCAGVSFAHGSNDGQKGVGLVMLILMGLVPAHFALDLNATPERVAATVTATQRLEAIVVKHRSKDEKASAAVLTQLQALRKDLGASKNVTEVARDQRFKVRKDILLADSALKKLLSHDVGLSQPEVAEVAKEREALRGLTDYAPTWVLIAIALSLGVGTMIGWKRIVVTVGEKIGKAHLTYAQGASAELVAASTIGVSAYAGLPVSTTHVLSSGIAGTMVAQGSGVQGGTIRNIALAWVLTLPVSMLLSSALYLGLRLIFV